MRASESRLIEYTMRYGQEVDKNEQANDYDCQCFDTKIPKSSITSLSSSSQCRILNNSNSLRKEDDYFIMHGVRVQKKRRSLSPSDTNGQIRMPPLVLLHGYANGALYYYRNLIGLANHFSEIYSLDLLGWGLSSRPSFVLQNKSVEAAESFFVEALEQWRQKHCPMDGKIIIAAHSMGAYLSIAYCEKYPQHVQNLVLISPVGIPHVSEEEQHARITQRMNTAVFLTSPFRMQLAKFIWERGCTPGIILRSISEERGRAIVSGYVKKRLPAVECEDEQESLIDYFYTNSVLPGSGEYALNRLLKPLAIARKPAVYRIPALKVPRVTFIYGEHDWMDHSGGMEVQQMCEDIRMNKQPSDGCTAPKINVIIVPNAGHLLMLDNWKEFNKSVLSAVYGEDYVKDISP
eukprot:CAMPEP_0172420056 /NCGR_PEP_ID=MMETSP1064-20121228/6449_1 /TAXON_ID=202472 /ORGANISM="Aulacoseira subarctica , Strain CCAP 1002/5" /LENGTH=404 /DNA_ID=CAMNT_0013159821 /DNA_START=120 /DNA_END=1334 /DNA_ORIENTATION=+